MIRIKVRNNTNEKKLELKVKFKGILLLFLLFAYSFGLVLFFSEGKSEAENLDVENRTSLVGLSNNLEFREVSELETLRVEENVEVRSSSVEEQGEVLGFWRESFMGRCGSTLGIEEPQLFCGSKGMSSSTDITLAEVYAPDILFLGAAAPFDNLVLTSNPAGRIAFPNASEIIDPENEYMVNMAPFPAGHPKDPRAKLLPEENQQDPFKFHLEAAGSMGETDFDTYPGEQSLCPQVVNDGRFNVKGSNQVQEDLTGMFSSPFKVKNGLGDRDVPAQLCRDDVRTIHLNEDESFQLCSEGFWAGLGCSVIDTIKGPDCEDIQGIVIDAPLGSGEVCNEDDCSVRQKEAARLISSPPTKTRDMYPQSLSAQQKEDDYIVDDPVLLTTPCKVRVGCKICLTKCFWDISIWNHYYELEKTYTYPGFKNAMTEDEYWRGVEHEIKTRSRLGTGVW